MAVHIYSRKITLTFFIFSFHNVICTVVNLNYRLHSIKRVDILSGDMEIQQNQEESVKAFEIRGVTDVRKRLTG